MAQDLIGSRPLSHNTAQEYFEDQDMREVYRNTLTRLLIVHYGGDEENKSQFLVNNEDSVIVFPPSPWPPWGDDDDDDGPKHDPKNATELAKLVVEFEWKLARASLDLSARLLQDLSRY